MKRLVIRALIVVAATLGIVLAQVAPASATAPVDPSGKLASNLAALWTAVLETPASENPFIGNGPECWDLGNRTVAQFGPGRVDPNDPNVRSCTVKPGTKIFVVGSSFECSTFDNDCDNDPPGSGLCDATTAPGLLECAQARDSKEAPTITVDGKPVKVSEVVVPSLSIVLPDGNLFVEPAGTEGLSAAHGWVTLLHPLTPGTHTIVISGGVFPTTTTTIVVTPGH
jgi:hypothetical protein